MKLPMVLFLLLSSGCNLTEPVAPVDGPIVVLTFDDGHSSIGDLAYPVMREYGYPGVNFIQSAVIGQGGFLRLETLREMEQAGWETGGHTVNHANLTTIPIDSARREIDENFLYLVGNGLMHRSFALPYGHSNAAVDAIILGKFDLIRTSNNERYHRPINTRKLGYYQVEGNDDAESLLLRVAHGISERECLVIFGFHQFTNGQPQTLTTVRLSEFRSFLRGVSDRGLIVATLADAVDRLQ